MRMHESLERLQAILLNEALRTLELTAQDVPNDALIKAKRDMLSILVQLLEAGARNRCWRRHGA